MSSPKHVTELLATQRWEPALDALLEAWRTHRASALERSINRLGAWLAQGLEPIDTDAEDWETQWQRRARERRAVELGVLLPLLTHPPMNGMPQRMRALAEFAPDPRIGAVLVEQIETPPTTSSSNFSVWTELFAALPTCADARVIKRLEARRANRGGKSQFWTKLDKWIAAVIPKLDKPARLPSAWKDDLAALDRTIAKLVKGPAPQLQVAAPSAPSYDEVDDLAGVVACLDADELARALDLLVGYWAGCRSPMLAEHIDRLGLLVDAEQTKPGGRGKTLHDAWMAAGEQPDAHAIGPLLATLREGKLADVQARIELMIDWRPDPRVAQTLMLMIADYMLGARDRLWRAIYEALVVHADPRVAERVRNRHDRLVGADVLHRHISEGRAVRKVFDAFVAAVGAPHELRGVQLSHAKAIEQALAKRVTNKHPEAGFERGLIEAIVADWGADAPRLVYADWLQSRSDPRGEFIALDLALARTGKGKTKRDKYLKSHNAALLGPLESVLGWGTEFERGLLTKARLQTRKGGLNVAADLRDEILEDLRWATIRKLHVDYDDHAIAELFERAPLLALEQLDNPGLVALQGLARRRDTLPLRSLEVSGQPEDDDDAWTRFGALAKVLPQLEQLEIMIWGSSGGRMTPPHACFRGELVSRVKLLRNGDKQTGGVARIDQWITRMIAARCPVPLLRVVGPELSADIQQPTLGQFELELQLDRLRWAHDAAELQLVTESLRGLPRDHVTAVRVGFGDVSDGNRRLVERALTGLPIERV